MLVGMKDSSVKFLINDLAACQDKKTKVAETFYKRQPVPSFVQTLSWKTMRTRPQHQYSLIRSSLSGARQEWDNAVGVRGARVGQPYPLAIDLSGG